jgi:ferredoxin
MPVVTARAHWIRAALSGAVGALVFVIPSSPKPVPAFSGTDLSYNPATQVMPPVSTSVAQSTGLYATACTSAGACVAGGNYEAARKPMEPMVARQSHGRWSRSTRLQLPADAARQPYSEVNGVACIKAGRCVAVGNYDYGRSNDLQAFVATESRGVWTRAFAPRLPANSAVPASAQLEAVACTHAGFCEAIGTYEDSSGNAQTMALAKPVGGGWLRATEVASPPDAASNPNAFMTGIACTGAGSCAAVGNYSVSSIQFAAMGAIESGGTWHRAATIAAPRNAIPSTFTAISSISCLPDGTCLGVGEYAVSASQSRAMSVVESGGSFGRAAEITAVPRSASLRPSTYLLGVSCTPAGACLAVGGGRNKRGNSVGMYMTRSGGRWRASFVSPPARARAGSRPSSALYAVSCTGRSRCTAVGNYDGGSGSRAEAASTARPARHHPADRDLDGAGSYPLH